jgi:protein gp37
MGETSKIEWTDATFNPWVGCTKVSPGCDNCYAEGWAKRSGRVTWGEERRRTTAANWRKPIQWHDKVPDGQRLRVFCASLADVFDNTVPDEWRDDLFELIRQTPRIDWLFLTKRIGNVKAMLPFDWGNSIYGYNNVWLGATVVNQEEADRDIPKLLDIPARVHFLSCEPLLGPINLTKGLNLGLRLKDGSMWGGSKPLISWVIVGGESGPRARVMQTGWAQEIVDDCMMHDVPVFFKQGSQANWADFKNFESYPSGLQVRQWPHSAPMTAGESDG